jgi:hypothetical protein
VLICPRGQTFLSTGVILHFLYKNYSCCLLILHSNLRCQYISDGTIRLSEAQPKSHFLINLCCLIWSKRLYWHWLLICLMHYPFPASVGQIWLSARNYHFPGEDNPGSRGQNCLIDRIFRDGWSRSSLRGCEPQVVCILQLLRGTSGIQPPETVQKETTQMRGLLQI